MTALLSINNTSSFLLSLTSNSTFMPPPPYMPTSVISGHLPRDCPPPHDPRPRGHDFEPAGADPHRRRRHPKRSSKVKKSPTGDVNIATSRENYRHSMWWEEQQRRTLGLSGGEEPKIRRSINSPAPGKPKEAQLYNINKRSVVEVHRNGSVSTTERTDSPYSIFRVIYLCSMFVISSLQTCSDSLKFSERLYFVESQKYLCIDNRRNIYTDSSANNTDCILKHEFLTNKYDIYYSDSYPRNLDRCLNTHRRSTTQVTENWKTNRHHSTSGNIKREESRDPRKKGRESRKGSRLRACTSRWYLGVGVDDRLKIFITGENRTKREMFFIQRWHHSKNMSYLSRGVELEGPAHGSRVDPTSKTSALRHSSQSLTEDYITENESSLSSSSSSSQQTIPPNTSPSLASSFSTSSPLKRTRSFFLNSLKHKKDKGSDCSNLLKMNCNVQEPTDKPRVDHHTFR